MKKKTKQPSKPAKARGQKVLRANQSAQLKLSDQARIEAALDRVLTLAMGLKRSSELAEIVGVFQQELNKLKFNLDNCVVWIIDGVTPSANVWLAPVGKNKFRHPAHFEFLDLPYFKQLINAWKKRKSIWVYELKGREKKKLDHQLFTQTDLFHLPDNVKKELMATDHAFVSISFYNYGGLHVSTPDQLSKEQLNILNRFSKAFDLCFTRLKDLEKAEAQAREAQIETALEKVRSRSLAMHKSQELQEVIYVVFEKLRDLGIEMGSASIIINRENPRDIDFWIATSDQVYSTSVFLPYIDFSISKDLVGARESGMEFFAKQYSFEEKNKWWEYAFEHTGFKAIPEERKKFILQSPHFSISAATTKNTGILITNYSEKILTGDSAEVVKRLARVFEQSYIRFRDLQKAEGQAREAQIEAALERVRATTLAMHKSEQLAEVAIVLFEQFYLLGKIPDRISIGTISEEAEVIEWWVTDQSGSQLNHKFFASIHEPTSMAKMYAAWMERKESILIELTGKDLEDWIRFVREELKLNVDDSNFKGKRVHQGAFFSKGLLLFSTNEVVGDDVMQLLVRFAGVFDQTYTRFLDLKKAEAQAREAQIETALERVRSRSLAMHKSEELQDVVNEVFTRLRDLEVGLDAANIFIWTEGSKDLETWTASSLSYTSRFLIPINANKHFQFLSNAVKNGTEFIAIRYSFEEKNELLKSLFEQTSYGHIDEDRKRFLLESPYFTVSVSIVKNIGFQLNSYSREAFSESENNTLKRFARVFEQSYTRFLDLQKAEAQAREAQIESSLERVRSKTMAMHNSEDVSIATNTMFDEIAKLGVESMRCGIGILNENQEMEVWTSAVTNEGHKMKGVGSLNVNRHPLWQQVYKGWKENDGVFFYHLAGDDLNAYYKALTSISSYSAPYITGELPEHDCYGFYFQDGAVFTFTYQTYSEEHLAIWKRFASVFSLTYRRYKDLKNAEAQTREAHIEAALERVRAKAMAMHSTADLTATVSTIFIELRDLGIKPLRFGLGIIERDTRNAALYSASVSDDGGDLQLLGSVVLDDHPILEKIYDDWLARSDGYFPVLKGDVLKTYYEKLRPGFKTPDWHADYEQYGQFYYFEEGSLYAWSEKPISSAEVPIFKRFTSVLALTYKRYNELQLSEANALEAVRRASIDRVRAEIASMRTTGDLERITPLIWNELTKLGVPFIRCGVFIMDNHAEIIHTFLSTPDGKAIGAFNLPYTTPGNIQQALSHWKKNEIYIDRWTEEVFKQFADTLVTLGALTSTDQYLSTIPHGGFYLHFLPFPQGMLYVGNTDELQKDHLQLIQAVSDAFSAAYTRYEDFSKLEAAKQQVDKTLADLKLTQNQLVQAEKMASLGELTAGIAHEIQNPLNFVNNFSEVSNELIDEMVEEVNKGNFDEAKAIALDVKKNLDKINHHGKRADGIVKNMLQHSQSGSGQKELTDINQLCDEYIRLSYHGLRAKDKSFNAKFETFFDPTLGKINVIPQEIGRVVLNLVNNAFYAANEKKNNVSGFEPKISITTKKQGDKIEITVTDNGTGIPVKMLDKIFQPFFTTKPTGQGTGLGLSLSYDIVKVHGGELKVETKEGEGSKFEVHLPF